MTVICNCALWITSTGWLKTDGYWQTAKLYTAHQSLPHNHSHENFTFHTESKTKFLTRLTWCPHPRGLPCTWQGRTCWRLAGCVRSRGLMTLTLGTAHCSLPPCQSVQAHRAWGRTQREHNWSGQGSEFSGRVGVCFSLTFIPISWSSVFLQ